MLPKKLQNKLNKRQESHALRQLGNSKELVDFSSNDYLGFSRSKNIFNKAHQYLTENKMIRNGATGSRLLTGNFGLYEVVENMLCEVHKSEAALVCNSGYDANLGIFSTIPQKDDFILYDEFIHASIRDGIKMSNAKAYKFKHNNLADLEKILIRLSDNAAEVDQLNPEVYVVTESVFSMDGDSPDLVKLVKLCYFYNAKLIIDEAHAVGVFGNNGEGLVQEIGLEKDVFIRLVTFGKAMGCHGAAILGSKETKQYLVNFSRPFIYTTALPPHTLSTIKFAYEELLVSNQFEKLHKNLSFFKEELLRLDIENKFIESHSPIQSCIIPNNDNVKRVAKSIEAIGFEVKPILSPTVPKGQERLRFCLHSYNTKLEITEILEKLTQLK